MRATLSIRGLYMYDSGLFDQLQLPEDMDADVLIANIMMECAELECIFPDPSTMEDAIGYWSRSRLSAWSRIWDALEAEYNPIWNKDGTIEEHTRGGGINHNWGLGTSTGKVAGMNSDTLNPASSTDSVSDTGGAFSNDTDFTRREFGNIGVTTSQSMLTEELALRSHNDIYALITTEFRNKFCLLVY